MKSQKLMWKLEVQAQNFEYFGSGGNWEHSSVGGGWKGKKALSHANILDDIAIKYLIAGEFVFNVNICYGCDYLL